MATRPPRGAHERPFDDWRFAALAMAALWLLYTVTLVIRSLLYGDLHWELVSVFGPRFVSGILLNIVLYVALRSLSPATSTRKRAGIALALCLVASLSQAVFAASVEKGIEVERESKTTSVEGLVIKQKGAQVTIYRSSDEPLTFTLPPVSDLSAMERARLTGNHAVVWLFFYAAWAAIYLAGVSAGQVATARRRLAEAEAAAQAAQVRALRYQINPHFLFNTLNSLSSLVMRGDNERAEDMLMALSTFFRTSLSLDPGATVPLSEEIALQRLYLDIEEVRFPKRLKIDIDVPEDAASVTVPALILQPLIENAIKYGVSATRKPVTLSIRAQRLDDARVQIDVANSAPDGKPGNDPGRRPAGTGTGLNNVCQRLAAHYGPAADCRFGPVDGGYRVSLAVPDTEPTK